MTKKLQNDLRKLSTTTRVAFISLTFLFACSFSAAHAQDDNSGPFFGKSAPGKWIIGVKAARVDPNVEQVDDADAVGLVVGYEFAKTIGGFGGTSSVELEYLQSDTTPTLTGSGTSYDAEVLNLFFTYRSPGTLYYKFKGGLSVATFEVNSVIPGLIEDSEDVSLAAGIGIGLRIQDRAFVELEYSQDTGESDFGILGLNALLQF